MSANPRDLSGGSKTSQSKGFKKDSAHSSVPTSEPSVTMAGRNRAFGQIAIDRLNSVIAEMNASTQNQSETKTNPPKTALQHKADEKQGSEADDSKSAEALRMMTDRESERPSSSTLIAGVPLPDLQTNDAENTSHGPQLEPERHEPGRSSFTRRAHGMVEKLGSDIFVLGDRILELEANNSYLKTQCAILAEDKQTISKKLEKLQQEFMKACDGRKDNALTDDEVKTEFDDFEMKCKSWIRKYAASHISDWNKVGELLKELLAAKQNKRSWITSAFFDNLQRGEISIRVALWTSMTHLVFRDVMEDPFYHHWSSQTQDPDMMSMIESIKDSKHSVGEEKAVLWRSLMLQILNQRDCQILSEQRKRKKGVAAAASARMKRFQRAATLIQSKCEILLKPLDSRNKTVEQGENLVEIISTLSDLCSALYAQSVRIKVCTSEADFSEFGGTHICARSEHLVPHASMKLDEHKSCKDPESCRVQCIVQPAVVAVHKKRFPNDRGWSVYRKGIAWGWIQQGKDEHVSGPRGAGSRNGGPPGTAGEHHEKPIVAKEFVRHDDEGPDEVENNIAPEADRSQGGPKMKARRGKQSHNRVEGESFGIGRGSFPPATEIDRPAESKPSRAIPGRSLRPSPHPSTTETLDLLDHQFPEETQVGNEDVLPVTRPCKRAKKSHNVDDAQSCTSSEASLETRLLL